MATKYRFSDNYIGRAKSAQFQENEHRLIMQRARERMVVQVDEKAEKNKTTRKLLPIILAFAVIYSIFLLVF